MGVSGLGEAIEVGGQSQDQEEYLRRVETHPEAKAGMGEAESYERSSSRQAANVPSDWPAPGG